uniref:E3 ubiquitin-protein ligase RNF181 family n=1 Tax=Cajanus cajan TaxID=3821 RepID=A0A151S7M1_CAJCA|nr:E3 ubiquitin-protein ligase RNF181 family [Cajanus cajan]
MAEDMKIDHVVEVPDTPDRITVRCDDQKYLGNPETRGRAFNVADEMNNHNNYIMSPSKESYSSQNAPIFRRAQTGKIIGLGAAHSDGAEKMEKGKTISSKFPSKPSHCRPISILDLSEENGQFQQLKPAFSNRGSRDKATEDKKAVNTDSSNTSRNAFTGKCKLDNKTLPGPNISVDRGKSRGHKRLVRNGCISPHNIATREKQLAEQSNHQTKDVEQSHALHSVSSNAVSPIGVNDIVSGERGSGRVKGKEVLAHPASHGHNIETLRAPSGIQTEWTGETLGVVKAANTYMVLIIPDVDLSSGTHIMFLGSSGESSSSSWSPVLDPEVVELLSAPMPRGSSSSQSPVLDPEVVELLSTPRHTNRLSEGLDDNDNNSSEARARQVEADEILARELQEQLYHDDSFEGRGIDEHLAWEMQHAENLLRTSIDIHDDMNHPARFPRGNRQPRTRSHQNSSRRRATSQVSLSDRMSQLRSHIASRTRPPIISSRGRGPQFPLDMDLDMRIDILEALEDSMGDFSDMGMVDGIFNARHDFNEADYEMLLALDEGNHQHTGASTNLINSLPQSTLQTNNFTEACAICLETPEKGETIRHLPCLHKFHKDCIDPWLRRKTSCPVCKSSIT